ncbi:MAG: acyltransferase family protein [Erysipelotrichaceae bacterium]
MDKRRFILLDIFRAVLCLAVLLYHLNLLKGGYLAVCCFFVLSGYLTTRSLLKKSKVDLKKHYISRFKKIYLPLLVVVLISIGAISLIKDVVWVSLKPETTSVLLGFNNFWQINANQDYFARHTASPFMHFWYIAILLQFELVYPLIFVLIKSTKKLAKWLPAVISSLLAVGFTVFFFIYSSKAPLTNVYYNTFSRLFSLLLGVAVCFIHHYLQIYSVSNQTFFKTIYYGSLIFLIVLFFIVDSSSKLFAGAMLISSMISCIIIECAISINKPKENFIDKILIFISNISYEVYLIQYPVIYIYQILSPYQDNIYLNAVIISLITFLISILIHFVLTKRSNLKKLQLTGLAITILFSGFGGYNYIIAEDHTEEMKQLEQQLAESAAEMEKQKEEYAEKLKQENDQWEKLLQELEPDEATIKETVSQLPVICIGDSVMLGAASNLRSQFENGYVDAEVSRSGWAMAEIIKSLTIKGPVVIHAGTNGDVPESVKDSIMAYCGDNEVFWVTVTNDKDVHVNDKLRKFVEKYDNAYLIDWQQYSSGHSDWFYSDDIHLQPAGRKAYTELIFNSIYQVKLQQLEKIKEDAIKEHENQLKNKISFFGNDLLAGQYDLLSGKYSEANFVTEKYLDDELLLSQIQKAKDDNTLNYKVMIVIDSSYNLTEETYQKIVNICTDNEIYIITTAKLTDISCEKIISFKETLDNHKEYYLADMVHLNQQGNQALFDYIVDALSQQQVSEN